MAAKKKSKNVSWESKYIECPFFKSMKEKSVCCEGIEKGSRLELSFRSAEQKRNYIATHCSSRYRYCLIARMNDLKYDDEGNEKQEKGGKLPL